MLGLRVLGFGLSRASLFRGPNSNEIVDLDGNDLDPT